MKIAIVGVSGFGGSAPLTSQLTGMLKQRGHAVEFHDVNDIPLAARNFKVRHRIDGKTSPQRAYESVLQRVRDAKPDVLIASEGSEILLEDWPTSTRKVFLPTASLSGESYFTLVADGTPFDVGVVAELLERERTLYSAADHIFFAWSTHERYVQKFVYDGPNIVPATSLGWFGCTPRETLASYRYPFALVFLGSLVYTWVNKELLSHLSSVSPYAIDVWGAPEPAAALRLRYKGVAPSEDVLLEYQFGVVTASKDLARRWGWSSKILAYLSAGMPCLYPDWYVCGDDIGGCIPYNEDNFVEVVDGFLDREIWEAKASEALEQAHALTWPKVLAPMIEIIEGT